MVEILSGALSGGVTIREKPITQNGNCVFMLAIAPAHVGGAAHFNAEVKQLTEFITSSPREEGCDENLLPGDPERRGLAERAKKGIPLDDGIWKQLTTLAEKLEVDSPEAA